MKKLLLGVLLFGWGICWAGDPHYSYPVASVTNYTSYEDGGCPALGIATSSLRFDKRSKSLQGSVGIGGCDENEALAGGLAWRPWDQSILFSGALAIERQHTGYNFSVSWDFK